MVEQTWGPVGIIQGDASVMEVFPVLAEDLEISGNQATAHYLYYFDPIPGVAGIGRHWSGKRF